MPHPIDNSTLRILNPIGKTVGTGFLVDKDLVVTCAHVVFSAEGYVGGTIKVQFTGQAEQLEALVEPAFWSDVDDKDVAILKIKTVPEKVIRLTMGPAGSCKLDAALYTFGYAKAADEDNLSGSGKFVNWSQESKVFQFHMHEADHGHSGAPVLDVKNGVVIGMLQKGEREIAFATPSETIWQVCPQLKPFIPPLPRRNPIVEGINLLPYDYDQRIQNFLTEYLGTDSHPVPFGGRDDALKMLDTWLAETTPYLLLAAPAGRGKSALLVRWLDSLKEHEYLALAFVPVSIRFGTNMERVFYAALAARLAFLHGDDIPASPETSTAVYRGLVSDYLAKPLANGRTLLVVLDGLDEAADWLAGADFMPGELPAGVRVVVSARFLAGDADSTAWLRRLNWDRNGMACAPCLTPLGHDGVRDVLFKMGCPLDELSQNVDIVKELHILSEGDPLLVGLYVDDLWAKGEAVTRLKPENLASIQPGYKGYFGRWWDDQEKLWGAETPLMRPNVQMLFNLLACAYSGMTRKDLVKLAPQELNRYTLDNALKALQRFTIGDGINQGYTFSHPKLGQYFWDALTPIEQAQVEGRFLAWCEQTFLEFIDGKRDPKKKTEVPVYVVRNYRAHLARAEQPIETWLLLIHHQQWAQAWFTVEGAYGGYLQDIQRVREQCNILDRQAIESFGKAPYLIQQFRCILIETSVYDIASKVFSELLVQLVKFEIWTIPQAWIYIRQMILDPKQQSDLILALIPYIPKTQLNSVLIFLSELENIEYRTNILIALLKFLPELLDVTVDTVKQIDSPKIRASLYGNISLIFPRFGDEAFKILETCITNATDQVDILKDFAKKLNLDFLDKVWCSSQRISDTQKRLGILCILAKRAPETYFQLAITQIKMVDDEWERVDFLKDILEYVPEKFFSDIFEIVKSIKTNWLQISILAQIAPSLSEEQIGEFLESAWKIKYGWERANLLCTLSQYLTLSQANKAIDMANEITDKGSRAKVLSFLARFKPSLARLALNDIYAIQDELDRISSLIKLSQVLPSLSSVTYATIWAIPDEGVRAHVLGNLLLEWPQAIDDALLAARGVRDPKERARALSTLIPYVPDIVNETLETLTKIQDQKEIANLLRKISPFISGYCLEKALVVANLVRGSRDRIDVLRSLALYADEENFQKVLITSEAIRDEREQVRLFCMFAENFSEIAEISLSLISYVESEHERSELICKLIPSLPNSRFKDVVTAIEQIDENYERALATCALAERMPEITETAQKLANKALAGTYNADKRALLQKKIIQLSTSDSKINPRKTVVAIESPEREKKINFDSYELIRRSILDKTFISRKNLLTELEKIVPVIVTCNEKYIHQDIYEAVRDVTTWWP